VLEIGATVVVNFKKLAIGCFHKIVVAVPAFPPALPPSDSSWSETVVVPLPHNFRNCVLMLVKREGSGRLHFPAGDDLNFPTEELRRHIYLQTDGVYQKSTRLTDSFLRMI